MKRDEILSRGAWLVLLACAFASTATLNAASGAQIKFRTKEKPAAEKKDDAKPLNAADEEKKDSPIVPEPETSIEEQEESEPIDPPAEPAEVDPPASPTRVDAYAVPPGDPLLSREIVPDAMKMTLETLAPTKKLRNARTLKASTRTSRVEFLPKKARASAYLNEDVLLENGKRAYSPFVVAYMNEALDPQPTDRVLFVELSDGYHAAVLGAVAREVFAVGADKNLTKRAATAMKTLGYANVFTRVGDPLEGWPEAAPFDKIVVGRAVEEIPQTLLDQLKEGGKIVAPVGDELRQLLVVAEKTAVGLETETLIPVAIDSFDSKTRETKLKDRDERQIVFINGGFEALDPVPAELIPTFPESSENASVIELPPPSPTPEGWYDAWNCKIVANADAREGERACVFDNAAVMDEHAKKDLNESRIRAATLPEERRVRTEYGIELIKKQRETELIARARQNVAFDGSAIKRAIFSGSYLLERFEERGVARGGLVFARIEFYDKDHKKLGDPIEALVDSTIYGVWTEFEREIAAPSKAREATVTIGILNGAGRLFVDDLDLRNKSSKDGKTSNSRRKK